MFRQTLDTEVRELLGQAKSHAWAREYFVTDLRACGFV